MILLIDPVSGFALFPQVRETLTKRVFYRPTDIYSVDQALLVKQNPAKYKPKENKELNSFQRFLTTVKLGHVVGAGWFGLIFGGEYARKNFNLDDDSFITKFIKNNTFFGTIGAVASLVIATLCKNVEEAATRGKLDGFVERTTVSSDGNSLTKDGAKDKDFPSMSQVVMKKTDKDEILNAVFAAKDKGVGSVICLRGITRCGKTMTSQALAVEMAKKSKTGKAQFWFAKEEAMRKSFADDMPLKLFEQFGIETTAKRIERLIANAMLEEDHVVIVLDEAHMLLGYEGKDGTKKYYDPNDPNQRSAVTDALGKIIAEKLKSSNCSNVTVVLTANSAAHAMAQHMRGRMDVDKFYDKPREEERKELIRIILEREITRKKDSTKMDVKFSDITDDDLSRLSKPGTENLLDRYGEFTNSADKDEKKNARDEAIRDGFGGNVKMLENRPVLHYQAIERVVERAVIDYAENGGGKEKLLTSIESALKKAVEDELEQKALWKRELLYYFGENVGNKAVLVSPG